MTMLFKNGMNIIRRFHTKLSNFELDRLCCPASINEIKTNIARRKGIGDANLVSELYQKLTNSSEMNKSEIETKLLHEIMRLPNRTHPDIEKYALEGKPKLMRLIGEKKAFPHKPLQFQEIAKRLNLIRSDQLGNFSGSKSYYVLGDFANLERALIQYALKTLMENNFELVSVPDIIPRTVVENCGLITNSERNQVFFLDKKLHGPDICLAGTSEMSLAALYEDHIFEEKELPIKLAAVSRCYRAETSNLTEERGLYRVHEFTKVEMFVIVTPEESDLMLEYIRDIQEKHFTPLDLHMQVLDMPPQELGAPAYRKYDIEAWLPGRNTYGEISSCSNCTDYQSRRLGIKYKTKNNELKFVHTLNGTASAIPRLLIALAETGQTQKGAIEVPTVLQKYMYGQKAIRKQTRIPQLKMIKRRS